MTSVAALLSVFVLVVGLFHGQLGNWSKSTGPGFFPFGSNGVSFSIIHRLKVTHLLEYESLPGKDDFKKEQN